MWVRHVAFEADRVVVTVALTPRRLACPECGYTTWFRYDTRPVESTWRHLDLGVWRLEVRSRLRRLACSTHGVRAEGVPFARPGSRFSRDFEDLVGFLATTADKTTICRLVRIDWDTVGRIITRVMGDSLDPGRLCELFEIGVDEVSWRKRHRYLTLVSNHRTNKVVWGAEGRDTATLDAFFAEVGTEEAAKITAVSMDMSAGYAKSVRKTAMPPKPSSATTRFTSWPSPPRPSTPYAARCGTSCAALTRPPPGASRGHGGRCSRTRATFIATRTLPSWAVPLRPGQRKKRKPQGFGQMRLPGPGRSTIAPLHPGLDHLNRSTRAGTRLPPHR